MGKNWLDPAELARDNSKFISPFPYCGVHSAHNCPRGFFRFRVSPCWDGQLGGLEYLVVRYLHSEAQKALEVAYGKFPRSHSWGRPNLNLELTGFVFHYKDLHVTAYLCFCGDPKCHTRDSMPKSGVDFERSVRHIHDRLVS